MFSFFLLSLLHSLSQRCSQQRHALHVAKALLLSCFQPTAAHRHESFPHLDALIDQRSKRAHLHRVGSQSIRKVDKWMLLSTTNAANRMKRVHHAPQRHESLFFEKEEEKKKTKNKMKYSSPVSYHAYPCELAGLQT
jgi:hypothetical protein